MTPFSQETNTSIYRNAVSSLNAFPSPGSLLNTNTIDSFKTNDKKKLIEDVARKVSLKRELG